MADVYERIHSAVQVIDSRTGVVYDYAKGNYGHPNKFFLFGTKPGGIIFVDRKEDGRQYEDRTLEEIADFLDAIIDKLPHM